MECDGGRGKSDLADDLAFFGLAEEAEMARKSRASEPCKIYPWHAQTFGLWAAVWRTWRTVGGVMGPIYRVGIDITQVRAAVELMAIPPASWPQVFAELQTMESEALAALAEQIKD